MIKTPEHPFTHTDYRGTRSDPYHWLRDRDNPAVLEHLKAENAQTEAYLKPVLSLKETLYRETLSRIQETDQDAPWSYGAYEYYFRTQAGLQYDIFCRRLKGSTEEVTLFDENTAAAEFDYFAIGEYALTLDQQWLAVSVDTEGNEYYTVWLIDLKTGMRKTLLENVAKTIVFSQDPTKLWYCTLDETQRPYQAWCHDLTGQTADQLIFEEKDPAFWLGISRSMSDQYLFVTLDSKLTSEVHFTSAYAPIGPLTCIRPREAGHEYDVEHQGEFFYIRSNKEAPYFTLKRCPITACPAVEWETVFAGSPETPLDGFCIFSQHLVLMARKEGLSQLYVLRTADLQGYWIAFDEPSYTVGIGHQWEFETTQIRLEYVSLKTPTQEYTFDLLSQEKTLIKQAPVLGDYNPADYTSERIFATASDGTRIPISLVYKKTLAGPRPLLMTGYGAYGLTTDPWFSYSRLSLLDRGFIFAIAHIRGGGELGEPWHEAGRFLHKKNTFTDFVACAEHLITQQYTTPAQFFISGGSAGGLLIGAVINQAPHLFRGAIAHVPFVDVLNTMMDESLPLTVLEYEEWGNPHDPVFYDYISSYAPYENIRHQAYPAVFATAGLNDPRVPYWEAAKWVARLRTHNTADTPILLKTHLSAGHQGLSGRYHAIEEVAEEFAWVLGA